MQFKNLLQSQKNQIYDLIQKNEMEPNDFKFDHILSTTLHSTKVQRLKHLSSDFYFIFDKPSGRVIGGRNREMVRYSPAVDDERVSKYIENWTAVTVEFIRWLHYLKREIEAPDHWSDRQQEEFNKKWLNSNTQFTEQEKILVDSGLDAVKQYLIEHVSNDEKVVQDIQENVEYLKHASKHAGRRDWMFIFIGLFVNKLAEWALNPQSWQTLVRVLVSGMEAVKSLHS